MIYNIEKTNNIHVQRRIVILANDHSYITARGIHRRILRCNGRTIVGYQTMVRYNDDFSEVEVIIYYRLLQKMFINSMLYLNLS